MGILKCSCTLLRSEGSEKRRILEKKKHQKWRIGSLFWTKSSLLRRKPPKVEVFQVLTKNLIKKKKTPKVEVFQVFVTKSGGFCSEIDKKSNLNKILHFWCFFSIFARIWVCREIRKD